MPTRYLYSGDREKFIELDHVHFEPQIHRERWIVCSSLVPLPTDRNPILLSSAGQWQFLLVAQFAGSMAVGSDAGFGCRAVITETKELELDDIKKIHDLFRAFDAAGASKRSIYKRPKPTSDNELSKPAYDANPKAGNA